MAVASLMSVFVWGGEAPLPDLTKDMSGIDRSLTYNLGATGMRGWIYTPHDHRVNLTYDDSQYGRQTGSSRQILVTHVGANSPADGVMQVDDVILGIDDQPFTDDARKSIARAIQEAEKSPVGGEEGNPKKTRSGSLVLLRWRAGKTESVELKMRVLGTYSDTAPYNCPKSARILDEAGAALQKETGMWKEISGIAMLATGDPRYMPQIKALAQEVGPPTLKFDMPKIGMGVWQMGYQGIFLSEYYLRTGDKSVAPAIKEISVTLAKGQSMFGTLGHGISALTEDGKFHGSIPPYGPVNECGVSANLAIVMGKRCGVKDPEIDAAVARANGFFGYYVDKGYLPYGEHEPCYGPNGGHANNGKGPMAAVLFGVQGNRIRETQYWSKMCVAAFPNTQVGHTGQGFSYLWRMVGADMGGPLAAAAFFKEISWHFDLARRCDGSFTYDGDEQYGPGKTEDNTYYGKSSYHGVSPTACHILSYAVALKNLCITGKDMKPVTVGEETKVPAWLTKQEVDEAIAAGRFEQRQKKLGVPELTAALGNWSPTVRCRAASELATRPDAQSLVPRLLKDAEGPNARLRLGACEALNQLKATQALPVFVRLLHHEDRGLRWLAARAIQNMGAAAQPVVNDILKAYIDTAEPPLPVNFADPLQLTHSQLNNALFRGLGDALKQADPKLVFKALRIGAQNSSGAGRGALNTYIESQLTADDVKVLMPDLLKAMKAPAPADAMFGNVIREAILNVLVKYRFREGIPACLLFAKTMGGHGSEYRTGQTMKKIETYGSAAKGLIPGLKELIEQFNAEVKSGNFPGGPDHNGRRVKDVQATIEFLEAAKDHPELLSAGPTPASTKDRRK